MAKKILKVVLFAVVWSVVAAVIIGGAALVGYEPISDAVKLFACIFLGWYAIKFTWRLIVRYRAKQRVEQLVNVEEPVADSNNYSLGLRWWKQVTETELRFKSILSFIKSSSLSEYGDPLYVLPWYFVIGDEESRQKNLFEHLNLPAPAIDNEILHSESNEDNWHLYNDSLLIEIPSSFRESSSQGAKPEWVELLNLLARHRKAEPLNGVLITVSAKSLLEKKYDELASEARTYRRLLEDAQQILDTQVPVNVVVTGIDGIAGVEAVLDTMTREQLNQVLGQPIQSGQEIETFTTDVVDRFSQYAHQQILQLLKENQSNADLLRLPQRLDELSKALELFNSTLFDTNLYAHTPPLSGVYLSACYRGETNGEAEAVFVHDLFTDIIPRERSNIISLGEAKKLRDKENKRLLATGGIAAAVLFGVLISVHNYHSNYIEQVVTDYYQGFDANDSVAASVNNLLAFNDTITAMEKTTWAPWYYTISSPEFVDEMQSGLTENIDKKVVNVVEKAFKSSLAGEYFAEGKLQDTVDYLGILVRRINLIKAVSEGKDSATLEEMPVAFDVRALAIDDEEVVANLNKLYIKSLVWKRASPDYDPEETILQIASYQRELAAIVVSNNSLNWLIEWANADRNLKSYSISDAWVGSAPLNEEVTVAKAFTLEGEKKINGFIDEIQSALGEEDEQAKVQLANAAKSFNDGYKRRFVDAWQKYAVGIMAGKQSLRGRSEWVDVANNLGSGRNVYFQALNLINEQLAVLDSDDVVPDWVAMVRYYQDMRALGPDDNTVDNSKRNKVLQKMALKAISKAGPLGKVVAKQGKGAMKTQKKLAKASGGGATVVDLRAEQIEEAATLLQDYHAAIDDFVFNSEAKSESFKSVSEAFASPDNPSKGEGSYAKAYSSVKKLQALVGKPNTDNRPFWDLYMGSLDFMLSYMVRESACYINDYWRDEFLADLESVPDYKKDEYLLGKAGSLWSLLDTTMKPFVKRRLGAGYVANSSSGLKLGLSQQFFTYISKASEVVSLPNDYKLTFTAMPTSVNPDAIHFVEETTVSLSCSDGSQRLVNQNYTVSDDFVWNKECSDTVLTMNLGHMSIKRAYAGNMGFIEFLKDFKSGKKRFIPSDFTKDEEDLRGMGIKYLDVEFQISSVDRIIADQSKRPPPIPQNISTCNS